QASKKYAHELGIYALDEFDLGEKIKINAGLRYSRFIQSGPYTRYEFDPITKLKKDSVVYQNGENVKTYGGFEPRLNARISISENSSIKASVARTFQYLHLVTNNGSTLPTDIWTPSSYFVRPQNAWQYSLGSFNNFFDNKLETSVEVYYKKMNNMVEYREGYIPGGITDIDYDFVFGTGDAYGAEFYINKTKGKFTGWISYTLAWTKRNFPQLNKGESYFAKYDQRHNLSVTSSYEINNKWSLSAVFIYGSGTRVTLPSELYIIDGQLLQNYDKLNNYRIPAYHRFDIAATYTPKPKKERRWQGSWNFGVYNLYSRQNPYFLYLDLPGNVATSGVEIKVKQVSVFPIIPSITYNFKFK
ncbi:MAG: TonB-dependent receptor, partial [Chitinophagaceae bacterium]|nr:TonB-dependent receptor [Chitinophagaceae bacterium]